MAFVIWAEILASTCGPTMGVAHVTVFMTLLKTSKHATSLMENSPGDCLKSSSFSAFISALFSLCSTSILLIERGAPSLLALSRQLRQSSYLARIILSHPLHLCLGSFS